MRTHVAVVTVEDLVEFLEREGRDPNSKDYEFHTALVLARFMSKQLGGKRMRIAFPARRERARDAASDDSMENVRKILRECLDQDHPFDVVIIPEEEVEARDTRRPRGYAFQLKRFLAKPEDADITEPLVAYLNETVPRKYATVKDAGLVLLPERRGNQQFTLDLAKARDLFRPVGYPFEQVLFAIADGSKIILGEIWPNFGRTEYSYDDWFSES